MSYMFYVTLEVNHNITNKDKTDHN